MRTMISSMAKSGMGKQIQFSGPWGIRQRRSALGYFGSATSELLKSLFSAGQECRPYHPKGIMHMMNKKSSIFRRGRILGGGGASPEPPGNFARAHSGARGEGPHFFPVVT